MIRSPLRLLALMAVAASIGGCVSLLPKATPAKLYSFGLAQGPSAPPVVGSRGVILGPVDFPREAMADGILTVEGAQTANITGARWMAPAPVLFRQALGHAFEAAAPGVHLLARGETGASSALLTLEVTRFEADYTDPKGPPTVRVTLRARLNADDGTPIDAAVYDVQKPVAENRVGPIVAAFDAATQEALASLAHWVDEKTPAAAQIRPGPGSTSSTTSTKSTTTTTTRQP